MSPLVLSELVIVKRVDFNRQFVDGIGIIHIFLNLKSQQSANPTICCDFTSIHSVIRSIIVPRIF